MRFVDFIPSLSKIEAHPGERLRDHHSWVAQVCKDQGRSETEKHFLWLVGVFHDAGKYSSIFQYYMACNGNVIDTLEVQQLVKDYKQHAIYGAYMYVWRVSQNIGTYIQNGLSKEEIKHYIIAGYYAISKHHGDLGNIPDSADIKSICKEIAKVRKQSEYIQQSSLEKDYQNLFSDQISLGNEESIFLFEMFLKCISNAEFGKGLFNLFDTIDAKFVHLYRHFYASLIYADKYKTIFQDKEINRVGEPIPTNLIDAFKKQKGYDTPSTSLNAFRNTIYDSVKKSLDSVSLTQHLYTLNSPTGSGKTYNLINAGLILRDKLATTGIHARIVYGLPFTSIIDQVFDELEKICEEMGINTSQLLVKHHSLADNHFDNESDEYIGDEGNKQKFFIEAREGEIIVTTFFQIFHAFFGKENRWLVKYPNIRNTIFLLDEIQSTPYKYRQNFKEMFELLAKEYNCYFILSSATLPLIFDPGQVRELLPNYVDFFAQMNRTKLDLTLIAENKKLTISEAYEHIKSSLQNNPQKHHLITLNTIKSSIKMYRLLQKDFGKKKDTVLIYLSTNIIPKQRKERIQQIKSLTKNGEKRVIVVSTQMIEAGVDIDLDIGFRDIGPIDSVVQILGRLNRNASKDQGILYLFQLSDEDSQKEKLFWEYIYDPLVRNISSHILNKYTQIEESSYKELFDEYFRYIKERQSKDTSQLIRQARNKADFLTVHEKFKLIENTETVDIFVELDAKAKSLWETKENLRKTIPNKWERKQLWDTQYKKDFGNYIISVDSKKAIKCGFNAKQMELGLVHLYEELLDLRYDQEIGFTIIDKNQDTLDDNFI